jgi:hypothetical protein
MNGQSMKGVDTVQGNTKGVLRLPIVLAILMGLALVAAAGVWIQKQMADDGVTKIEANLLDHNKNDDKDNCPNDGNAGKGNDDKGPNGGCREHPPHGGYGKPDKNESDDASAGVGLPSGAP